MEKRGEQNKSRIMLVEFEDNGVKAGCCFLLTEEPYFSLIFYNFNTISGLLFNLPFAFFNLFLYFTWFPGW